MDIKNTYKISQHAKERYAERIRDKNDLTDIVSFVKHNEARIISDINTMIYYGTMIYEGKQLNEPTNRIAQVYMKDTWVIIADSARMNVITLYSIDLGLGSEFNKDYINRMLEKIDEEKAKIAEISKQIESQRNTYQELIDENQGLIDKYSTIVKSLRKQNEDYQEVVKDLDVNKELAEVTLRQYLGKLIGKKSF